MEWCARTFASHSFTSSGFVDVFLSSFVSILFVICYLLFFPRKSQVKHTPSLLSTRVHNFALTICLSKFYSEFELLKVQQSLRLCHWLIFQNYNCLRWHEVTEVWKHHLFFVIIETYEIMKFSTIIENNNHFKYPFCEK